MFDNNYKEIKVSTTGVYKEKGSKFIAYAFTVYSEDEVKEKLEEVKKIEYSARHHCYAYIYILTNQHKEQMMMENPLLLQVNPF